MEILLTDTIQDEVLTLFREEIPGYSDSNRKKIALEFHSGLFEFPGDDLHEALYKYKNKFNVDLSKVKWSCYFPWEEYSNANTVV